MSPQNNIIGYIFSIWNTVFTTLLNYEYEKFFIGMTEFVSSHKNELFYIFNVFIFVIVANKFFSQKKIIIKMKSYQECLSQQINKISCEKQNLEYEISVLKEKIKFHTQNNQNLEEVIDSCVKQCNLVISSTSKWQETDESINKQRLILRIVGKLSKINDILKSTDMDGYETQEYSDDEEKPI